MATPMDTAPSPIPLACGVTLPPKAVAALATARADRKQFNVLQEAAHTHRPALVEAFRRATTTLDWTALYDVLSRLCRAGTNYRGEYPPAYSALRWTPAMNMVYDRRTSLNKGYADTIKTAQDWATSSRFDDIFLSRIGVVLSLDPEFYAEPMSPVTDVGLVDLVCRASLLSGAMAIAYDPKLAIHVTSHAEQLAHVTGIEIEPRHVEALLCSDAWRQCTHPEKVRRLHAVKSPLLDTERDLALGACRDFLRQPHHPQTNDPDVNLWLDLERAWHPQGMKHHLVVQTMVLLLRPLLGHVVAPDLVTVVVEFAAGSTKPL